MSFLQSLKLSNEVKREHQSPVIIRRNKLVEKLHEQLMLANANLEGKQYEVAVVRKQKDSESGAVQKVDGTRVVRPWWFAAESGKLMMQVKYGNKVIQLAKGKASIEVGTMDKLVQTIEVLKKATLGGELDAQIEASIA